MNRMCKHQAYNAQGLISDQSILFYLQHLPENINPSRGRVDLSKRHFNLKEGWN